MEQTKYFLLVVSNWQQRRQSLLSILSQVSPDCLVSTATFTQTWKLINERVPDVIVVDRWFPGDDVTELVTVIKQKFPSIRILVLDCYAERNRSFHLYPADLVLEYDLPSYQVVEAVSQLLLTPAVISKDDKEEKFDSEN